MERGVYLWSEGFSSWSQMGFQCSEAGCDCDESVKCHLSSVGLCELNDCLFARILF